jgi:hypothetical protein
LAKDPRQFWADRFQTHCARHLHIDGNHDVEIDGIGPASYALADEILAALDAAKAADETKKE